MGRVEERKLQVPADDRLFCPKPFTWFEVSRRTREGEVFTCCPSWLETPIGNLDEQSVAEVWNSPAAQDIRRSILDGTFEYCSRDRCPYLSTVASPVQRVSDVTDPVMLDIIRDQVTVLPFGPREVNCSHDRSCNLSCPSCRTQLIVETQRREQIGRIQRRINDEALRDAELLYITGSGDPFGSPFFRTWLRTMRRVDMPKLTTLHLHSNGQLWTPRMWETIPEEIRELVRYADISIDAATPETYAINRRGGHWDVLLENMEFIASLRRAGPVTWLGVGFVVQMNNFREMPAFVNLVRGFGVDTVHFSQLVNWGTFSDAEYEHRAVHRPEHPAHAEFVSLLGDAIFDDPIVFMSNLSHLRSTPVSPPAAPFTPATTDSRLATA
jgi:MoaA/NifB/PqqE/SkfB family radical SAM enzyme